MFLACESPLTLEPEDAAYMAAFLCRPGSEMARELANGSTDTPMAVVYESDPVAWVATHQFRGLQTLEGYTHVDYRRRGWCRIAAQMLLASGYLTRDEPIAVFSPDCVPLVQSLGFAGHVLFLRDERGSWRPRSV